MYPSLGYSQNLQHYKSIADTTNDTLLKLEALDSVLSKSPTKNNDVFIDYSIQYITLAKEIDSINLAAKKAIDLQYTLTTYKNDPDKAVVLIDEILEYKNKIKDSFLLGGLYLKRGGANFRINYTEAIKDYCNAINNFGEKDSIYVADTYLFRGQAHSSLGNFVPACNDYKSAYIYYENLKDYEYMQYALQGNITMFSMNGFYDKAKKERDILIKKLIDLKLQKSLAMSYFNQSLDYKKQGFKKRQFAYLKKADSILVLYKNFNSLDYIIIHSSLADYYSDRDEYKKAESQIKSLDSKKEIVVGDLFAETYYYGSKANYYIKIRDFKQALIFANKKMESSRKLNHTEDLLDAHLLKSNLFYNLEDFEKSLDNKNKYYAIKDSIFSRNSANSLAYYQTLYETEKKEKDLVEKNASIQLLEKDNDTFKKLSFIIGIALVLFFGIILLVRIQQNLKNKKQQQERFSQDLLQSQENERKRISKDLHDGLGQKLLILKNQLISSSNNSTKMLVDETIDELRSISRDLHPFQLQELGITKAIEFTINQIDENTSLFISSEIENIDNLFAKDQEVNIYRIVQESLSNIIKHAKAEASKVSINKLTNAIVISIKDNGIGYNFTEKYIDSDSLGLKTLLERTKFLKGQMKVHSNKEEGTLIEYTFPIL